jgi:hypothetical protein
LTKRAFTCATDRLSSGRTVTSRRSKLRNVVGRVTIASTVDAGERPRKTTIS